MQFLSHIHNTQLLDLPGIIEGAKDGKGRGRQVIAVARTCNLIMITLDAMKPMTDKKLIEVHILSRCHCAI
jgi:ribosome-interacting GTPase 1